MMDVAAKKQEPLTGGSLFNLMGFPVNINVTNYQK